MSNRLLRIIFLWVGMMCLTFSLDWSVAQSFGVSFMALAVMPDD